jgi:hypothetical protein
MTNDTTYSDILGYPGYRVGANGTVWSCRGRPGRNGIVPVLSNTWRQLRPAVNEHGYHQVRLSSADLTPHDFRVHQLVARAFVPNPHQRGEINHKNGDKADNSAGNLEWATRSENILHAFRTGLKTSRHGELCSWAKLTAEDVRAIRQIGRGSRTLVSLAMQFGVSAPTIRSIINRTIWKHAV